MEIVDVRCRVLRVPYTLPVREAPAEQESCLLEITASDGVTGYAVASYSSRRAVRDFITNQVAPVLVGLDPLRPELVRNAMYWQLASKYMTGIWSCAASMVDVALWDLRGKVYGEPIWRLLGGARDTVPVYSTFGMPIFEDDELVEAARRMVAEGHTKLKIAIAAGKTPIGGLYGQPLDSDLVRDVARVRSVREAVGEDIELMIDANKNPTYMQALWLCRQLEDVRLLWFEDPIPQGDPRLMAQLRGATTIPLASGSTGTSDLMHFREYLLHQAVDLIQPNVRDIGGYTGALKAAALAQAFNVTIGMGGSWAAINLHLHGGVANGGLVEWPIAQHQVVDTLFDGLVKPVNGWLDMPTAPGLGLSVRPGAIEEYAVE